MKTNPHCRSTVVCSVRFAIDSLTCLSYPTYTSVLLRAIEWWYHDPNVSTPVLKLMAELVQNRSQRLHFDVSSPNGILLFRVTSEMIVAYGMNVTDWNVQFIVSHAESVLFKMQHYQDNKGGQSCHYNPRVINLWAIARRSALNQKLEPENTNYCFRFDFAHAFNFNNGFWTCVYRAIVVTNTGASSSFSRGLDSPVPSKKMVTFRNKIGGSDICWQANKLNYWRQ